MPFPAKTGNVTALLWKVETVAGTFTAPSASTDGKLLALSDRYQLPIKPTYLYDGAVGPSVGNTAFLWRAGKAGKGFDLEVPMRFKGYGAIYTAGNKSPMHELLMCAGYTAAFATGAWTYANELDSAVSSTGSFELYKSGQRYRGAGALASLSYESQNGAPPLFLFKTKAVAEGDVTDTAVPAITYPLPAVLEPVSTGATITIGTWLTAAVRKVSFDDGRNIDSARFNLNGAAVHLGYVPTERNPSWTVTVERSAFVGSPFISASGIDYAKIAEAASQHTLGCTWGTVQYNRIAHALNLAQLADYTESVDQGVAVVELKFEPKASTPNAFDWSTFVTN